MNPYADLISKSASFLKEQKIVHNPKAAVILGSGLGDFTDYIEDAKSIDYGDIPGFPTVSVVGHKGSLFSGKVQGVETIAFAGRFHFYEGYPLTKTIVPVLLAKELGCELLVVSNAAGSVNYRFRVGDLMLIDDIMHLGRKLSVSNKQETFRYTNEEMVDRVERIAADSEIAVRKGCYLYMTGPTYETKAEIRAFRLIGVDTVGMSTAPELLEAKRLGMETIGISLVTNMATGVSKTTLDHSEIKEAAEMRKEDFARLVAAIVHQECG